jgi:tetratricopeptide (TPR) repeat protein
MKTKFAIAAALLLSLTTFAQKDELKAMRKIAESEKQPTPQDIQAFKGLLDKAEPLMANATTEQKAEFHYYKGMYDFMESMMNPAKAQQSLTSAIDNFNRVIEFEKDAKKKEYSKEIQEQIYPEVKALLINAAGSLGKQSQFAAAIPLYETAYKISPKDTVYLFNAAAYAVNAKDYNTALKHFQELDRLGFTNRKLSYTAKNTKGETEYFGDIKTRDLYIKNGGYTSPGVHKDPSVRGDIVKNIALIYIQQGETQKALDAMGKARKANPNDTGLMIAEAELYLKTDNKEMYKKLITEAAEKNPNNADLFYNLAVMSSATDKAEAMKHYERTLQINPNHVNANFNMGVLVLDGEKAIVDEMNKPSTSDKRYDELKAQRNALYRKSLTYFEAAHKADPKNVTVMDAMVGIYQALEMTAEAKAIKAKMNQ